MIICHFANENNLFNIQIMISSTCVWGEDRLWTVSCLETCSHQWTIIKSNANRCEIFTVDFENLELLFHGARKFSVKSAGKITSMLNEITTDRNNINVQPMILPMILIHVTLVLFETIISIYHISSKRMKFCKNFTTLMIIFFSKKNIYFYYNRDKNTMKHFSINLPYLQEDTIE